VGRKNRNVRIKIPALTEPRPRRLIVKKFMAGLLARNNCSTPSQFYKIKSVAFAEQKTFLQLRGSTGIPKHRNPKLKQLVTGFPILPDTYRGTIKCKRTVDEDKFYFL